MPRQKGFAHLGLIFILVLLVAIPLGIYLVRNQQLFKSKAYQPAPVSAPDLSITLVSDKGLYKVGDPVRVSIYVKNAIEAANLYVVKLKYPTNLLSSPSTDTTPGDSTFVQSWTQKIIDPSAGTVDLVAELQNLNGNGNSGYATPANTQYGSLLANLNFTAQATGLLPITFNQEATESSAIYSAYTNDNILMHTTPVNIEINESGSGTPPPSATPIPTNESKESPTPAPTCQPYTPPICRDSLVPCPSPIAPPGGWCSSDNTCKTGVNSFSVSNQCSNGYRYATLQCYDTYSQAIGDANSCQTESELYAQATKICQNRSSCAINRDPAAIYPDINTNPASGKSFSLKNKQTSNDFSRLNSYYNMTTENSKVADLDNNGIVNSADRTRLLCEFGKNNVYVYYCKN